MGQFLKTDKVKDYEVCFEDVHLLLPSFNGDDFESPSSFHHCGSDKWVGYFLRQRSL